MINVLVKGDEGNEGMRTLEVARANISGTGRKKDDPRYIDYHYKDNELLAMLRSTETEAGLFRNDVGNPVWVSLAQAKNSIDALLLSHKINDHIMEISIEDELFVWIQHRRHPPL